MYHRCHLAANISLQIRWRLTIIHNIVTGNNIINQVLRLMHHRIKELGPASSLAYHCHAFSLVQITVRTSPIPLFRYQSAQLINIY
jgi:hypothetical protein